MVLSEEMRAELDRRIEVAERERAEDPASVDLPRADRWWLLVLLALSLIGIVLLIATRSRGVRLLNRSSAQLRGLCC